MPYDALRPAPPGGFKAIIDTGYIVTTAPDEYGVVEVLEMFVREAYRRKGGGRRLMQIVREWGAEHGAKRIIVQCSPRNEAGRSFYAALGMREVAVVFQEDLLAERQA